MNTQNKNLVFTAIFLSLSLIGCGGGGDSSSDNSKPSTVQDSLDNGTRYYSVDYALNKGSDNLTMKYFEIFNKQFKDETTNTSLNIYVLTANKLYTPQEIVANTVALNSMTSWTLTFIGNVKTDIKLEKVDVSGKNIFDTVLPGYRSLGFDSENSYFEARKLLASYGNDRFPQGSNCYRFISRKNNQDYFSFNADDELNKTFEEFDSGNLSYVDYLNKTYEGLGITYRYSSGNWQNVPWTTIYETDTGVRDKSAVAVKYQNKTYLADYDSEIEWTRAKEIKQWEKLLAAATTDKQRRTATLNIERLKNGCFIYNTQAASALVSLRLIDWNK